MVVFGSFQDYLGRDRYGNINTKNEWVHSIHWDLIVLDEYHFGAWNDNAKSLLDLGDAEAKKRQAEEDEVMSESGIDVESGRAWDDSDVPITGKHYLYLSGTPFRALATGEFIENQIFNWTYQDEQARKEAVGGPYLEMPTMVMMTYQMPQDLGAMIEQWDMDGFDLNEFFRAEGKTFVHEKAVQKWHKWHAVSTPLEQCAIGECGQYHSATSVEQSRSHGRHYENRRFPCLRQ